MCGIGYWDIKDNSLEGCWFYHYEVDASLEVLENKPDFFESKTIDLVTDEGRLWQLHRS
jgi:hypothetical protein